jgi:hypothetical protein
MADVHAIGLLRAARFRNPANIRNPPIYAQDAQIASSSCLAGSRVRMLFSYKYEQHPDFGTLSYGPIFDS